MKRSLVALLAAALLGVLLVTLRREPEQAGAIAPDAVEIEREDAPIESPAPLPATGDARAAVTAAPVIEAEPAVPAPTAAAPEPEPLARIEGRIVVLDELGIEHASEDGLLELTFWTSEMGRVESGPVEDGRFALELPQGEAIEALGVVSIVLGERAAAPVIDAEIGERMPMPANGWLELRARWVPDALLHVTDARDGRELAPVFVAEVLGWPEEELAHPTGAAGSAQDLGASPVRLPPRADGSLWRRTLFARSPGFAWGKIEIDPSSGGERFLALVPGGDLAVRVEGDLGGAVARLRLRAAGGSTPLVDLALAGSGELAIDALAPGEYVARAELGDWWDEPLVLGEARANVVAGESTRVVLRVERAAPVTRVPFAGTLELPEAWELDDFSLVLELLDPSLDGGDGRFYLDDSQMQRSAEDARVWTWKLPASQPGRYDAELFQLGFSVVLELPEGGTRDARIVVPPPCDVEVRCIDVDTGRAVQDASVSWRAEVPAGVDSYSLESARWDAERACWRFRAPIGKVLLHVSSAEYADADPDPSFALQQGANELVLRVERLCGLKIVLRDAESILPWDDDQPPELEALEGQENPPAWSSTGGAITLLRRQPGLYRLKVPAIDGYELVPDATMRLEKGVVVEHVIELERVR